MMNDDESAVCLNAKIFIRTSLIFVVDRFLNAHFMVI